MNVCPRALSTKYGSEAGRASRVPSVEHDDGVLWAAAALHRSVIRTSCDGAGGNVISISSNALSGHGLD
jgi:hypothetical protein